MRIYIEAIEKLPPDLTEEPEFVRIDVTGYSEAEIDEVVSNVKELMSGLSYVLQKHYCHHDKEGACRVEILEEV